MTTRERSRKVLPRAMWGVNHNRRRNMAAVSFGIFFQHLAVIALIAFSLTAVSDGCTHDSDCDSVYQVCCKDECVYRSSCICSSVSDCSTGESCCNSECVYGSSCLGQSCSSDSDCSTGESCCGSECVDGSSCVGRYCSSDSDCSSGESCCSRSCASGSSCFGQSCSSNSDCSTGESCCGSECVHGSSCLGQSCSSDFDCSVGENCCYGECLNGSSCFIRSCSSDSDCYGWESCCNSQCKLDCEGSSCSIDSDCGSSVNWTTCCYGTCKYRYEDCSKPMSSTESAFLIIGVIIGSFVAFGVCCVCFCYPCGGGTSANKQSRTIVARSVSPTPVTTTTRNQEPHGRVIIVRKVTAVITRVTTRRAMGRDPPHREQVPYHSPQEQQTADPAPYNASSPRAQGRSGGIYAPQPSYGAFQSAQVV